MKKIILLSSLAVLFTGCVSAPKSLYNWGSYPEQSYLMYSAPQKATPAAQIIKLEADIEKAKGKGLAVPPGLYAHLGLMYLQQDNSQKAAQYFQLEKQVYPESSVLMDRLSQKLTAQTGQP